MPPPLQRTVYFISHPNIEISANVPVTQWPLSEIGKTRMMQMLKHAWVNTVTSVYCSREQKSIDGAAILAEHLHLKFKAIHDLGENDRSATGYLKREEFEATADAFFASPDQSIRGWETANDAQARITNCVQKIVYEDKSDGDIAIVSHGAVGTLLYCNLVQERIDRQWDQPDNGGGNYLKISSSGHTTCTWWQPID